MFKNLSFNSGLSLERLRVLIEVGDAGSIAEAAPGDLAKQSQYSRQLRELSEHFGCEMTRRQGRVLKLTSEGAHLMALARAFFQQLQDFKSKCAHERTAFTIGAGDSLIQWLIIPRLGRLAKRLPDVLFDTLSLRTNEIVRHTVESRVDFGVVRKDAVPRGLKHYRLGVLNYRLVIPNALANAQGASDFSVIKKIPLAIQTSDGQFAKLVRQIILDQTGSFHPSLGCQSFPQILAAIRSGNYAAIVPSLAIHELPAGSVQTISAPCLKLLEREIVLLWNPRTVKVRTLAAKVASELQSALTLS